MRSRIVPRLLSCLSVAIAVLFVCPLLWLVISAMQPSGKLPQAVPPLIPTALTLDNFGRVFDLYGLGRQLLNSLIVEAFAVPITLVTASVAGFAMARLPNPARRWLVLITIIFMVVPIPTLWLPRFVMYAAVGLIDTLLVLIVPALMGSSPFFVLLYYWTFRRQPVDLLDAARLDGASLWRLWRSISLPMAHTTTAVVAVLTFVLYWSDYLSPLVYIRSENLYTFSLRLQMFITQDRTNQPLAMAAVVVAIVPVVLLFLWVQRTFWPESREGNHSPKG